MIGCHCWMDCVLDRLILTRWTLVCPPTAGSFSLVRFRTDTSAQKCCGLDSPRRTRLSCVRNRVRLLDFPSWLCRLRPSRASLRTFSAVLLQIRRLWLPLPLSSRTCRCGRLLDVFCHHRAACSRAGVLASRGFSVASACEGLPRGRCPRLHQPVRVGLGLASCASRWSTIGSSLTGFRSSMVLIDTTLVSPVCADGLPRVSVLTWTAPLSPKPVVSSNALIQSSGTHGRARLVVLEAEIGGRWSEEVRAFVSQLAKTKARSVPRIFAGRARQAWHHRWSSMLACANHLPCCWIVGLLWVATENFHLRPLVVKECRHLPFDSTL